MHGYVYAEVWGAPDGTEVEMSSKPTYMGADGSEWVTHSQHMGSVNNDSSCRMPQAVAPL